MINEETPDPFYRSTHHNIMKNIEKSFFMFLHMAMVLNSCSQSNILIFGGNGFIGSETVSQLLEKSHNITVVNRGSEHYDYRSRIKPYVTHARCDRYNGLARCDELRHKAEMYDFVIDFSAYHPMVIEDALDYLKGRFHTYIYISSDSVYEVCLPTAREFSKESDAIRYPPGPEQIEVNNRDSYGHYKLQAEEVLQREHEASGIQFIILRLPDVFGPRGTLFRWWVYQTWYQFYEKLKQPLAIPKGIRSTSYVYVKDVAKALTEIIEHILNKNLKIINEAYNLGFPKAITLRQMLDSMQHILGVQGTEYRYADNAYYLYPSVFRGPVDISKATEMLQWEATTWFDAVNETVQFYKEAFYKYPNERNKMLEKFKLLVTPEDFLLISREIEKVISGKVKDTSGNLPKDEL